MTQTWGLALAATMPLLTSSIGSASEGQTRCQLSVRTRPGGNAHQAAWGRAARKLSEDAQRGRVTLRCQRLSLRVRHDGALLAFYVADGRRAVRFMKAPDELVPTVTALSVVAPTWGRPLPPPQPTASLPRDELIPPSSSNEEEAAGLHAVLQTGLRGGQGSLAAPLLLGRALWGDAGSELGVLASIERAYGPHHETRAPSFGLGVQAGLKRGFGSGKLHAGAQAELSLLHGGDTQADRSEARLGAYTSVSSAQWLPVPVRADAGLSFTPARLWNPAGPPDAPPSPWWALSLAIGVEFGGA